VEKELSGSKTGEKRVLNKALSRRILRKRLEMGQTTINKPVRHSISVNNLLTNTSNHLAEIDVRAL